MSEKEPMRVQMVRLDPSGQPVEQWVAIPATDVQMTSKPEPWLDREWPVTLRGAKATITITSSVVTVPMMALLTGYHVVDLGELWEPHIIRGTQ